MKTLAICILILSNYERVYRLGFAIRAYFNYDEDTLNMLIDNNTLPENSGVQDYKKLCKISILEFSISLFLTILATFILAVI